MSDIPKRRKERKYNLSNVSKIQDIPPQSEFILHESLNYAQADKQKYDEQAGLQHENEVRHRLGHSPESPDEHRHLGKSTLTHSTEHHLDHFKMSKSSSPTTQGMNTPAFNPAERDLGRTKDMNLGICSTIQEVERENNEGDSARKFPGGIQKACVDTPNGTPIITINKAEVDHSLNNQEERLQKMRQNLEQTFGNNPNQLKNSFASISERLPEENKELNGSNIKLSNAFSFQDSPPSNALIRPSQNQLIDNNTKGLSQLVQQATFGTPADTELLQSFRSVHSRETSENSKISKVAIDEQPQQSSFSQMRSLEKIIESNSTNANDQIMLDESPMRHAVSEQELNTNHQTLRIPTQSSSPRSPSMEQHNESEDKSKPASVNYQVSFQTSPNLNSVGIFNKVIPQTMIDLKVNNETPLNKTDSGEDRTFIKQDNGNSPAHTTKSMTHPVLHTHASLPGRTPVSPEDKSPSIAPSEREISKKESKSVRGGAENRTGGNIERMKKMLDNSLRSGAVSKRSGSFIDLDDAKSAKSYINEDKMKRRIKEQFPTNDEFLENASGRSDDLNDQQANYTQKVKNNQIMDDKLLRDRIARGEGHSNIHHHHQQYQGEPGATLRTEHDKAAVVVEKPLFSNIYPRLAVVMVLMLFVEITRKMLGY